MPMEASTVQLNDIALFVEVAKRKSFSLAARALDMPTSTLSRRLFPNILFDGKRFLFFERLLFVMNRPAIKILHFELIFGSCSIPLTYR